MAWDDDDGLLLLLGLWLYSEAQSAVPRAVKSLERGGARIYEATHGDADHSDDLPGKRWKKAQLVALAKRVGFVDPNMAAAIALAESLGDEHAIGDNSSSFGLWQIHVPAHPEYSRDELMDPEKNAVAAYRISGGGRSWDAWSTFDPSPRHPHNTGAYRKYL